eukprot:Lithocolla_globosa_v1_NODE_5857_length_1174_cov_17.355675.p1 type:complete len:182 gc:universal NODE_5857_length_1174_cov_17.355675:227-772(+)
MPNYQQAKIYKIVCNENDDVYVGSTCQSLSQRMSGHRVQYRKWKADTYHFVSSFDVVQYDSAEIILIEDYPCERKEQLHSRERYWIEQMKCVNKNIPTRTWKEYRQDNAERSREYQREYQRQYRQDHSEQIREYYQAHAEELNQPNDCPCGGMYTKQHKVRHIKSKKHKQYLATQPPEYEI